MLLRPAQRFRLATKVRLHDNVLGTDDTDHLVKAGSQGYQTEPHITASGLLLTLQEAPHTKVEGLLRQHVFIRAQGTPLERALAPTIHLPQAVVFGLDEANIVQVDGCIGLGSSRVAARSCRLVRALQGL